MKSIKSLIVSAVLSVALLSACSSSIGGLGSSMELINSLGKLGVTPDQAIGGVGALMNLAQGKLSADDFSKVAGSIPNLDQLMKQAEGLGAFTGPLTSMAGVESSFEKLGMDKSKVSEFVPEVTNFASKNGGQDVGNLLNGALK
jgi:hypothetical protein